MGGRTDVFLFHVSIVDVGGGQGVILVLVVTDQEVQILQPRLCESRPPHPPPTIMSRSKFIFTDSSFSGIKDCKV